MRQWHAINESGLLQKITELRRGDVFSCVAYDPPGVMIDVNLCATGQASKIMVWGRFIDATIFGRNNIIPAVVVPGVLVYDWGISNLHAWRVYPTGCASQEPIPAFLVCGDASICSTVPVSATVVWGAPGQKMLELKQQLDEAVKVINNAKPTNIQR